jgi:serine/threonine-protein kinase RsbW
MLIAYFDIEPITQKLALESSLESIDTVENLINKIKDEYTIKDEQYNHIWIVLNEAVTNAIKHGNKYDPFKKVRLSVTLKDERYICFTVEDDGVGFDHTNIPDPTTPERISEPNGRGVFLINKLADTVNYSSNGTILEMCFDLFKN